MSEERPFVLCLTGSLGMGKSTAAKFFAEEGVPVHDSDATVHALYEGEATSLIEAAFPGSTSGGKVDRNKLAAMVLNDKAELARLEAIVHPMVTASREKFLAQAQARGAKIVVFDVPLLFETKAERGCDAVVVVSAPPENSTPTGFRAARHDGRQAYSHPRQTDAGRRKAQPRRFCCR